MSTVQSPTPAKRPWADHRSSGDVSGSSPARGRTKRVTLKLSGSGSARAPKSSVLPGPLGGIKPHAFGKAQLCPRKQVNKRLSSV